MGFFSFMTTDTDESIANAYSDRETYTVYMRDDKGNFWTEPLYDGYGEFGGKDFHELLAEMNGFGPDRDRGIDLFFNSDDYDTLYPSLSFDKDYEWCNKVTVDCPDQGYFYEF